MTADAAVVATASGIVEGPQETTWPVAPPLVEDEGYTWRVRAFDGALDSGWSADVPFRVNAQPDPPTAPTLIAPPEGAIVEVRRPALVVGNAVSPDGLDLTYEFELYRQATDGTLTLLEAQAGVLPGADRTSFDAHRGPARRRLQLAARARDVNQAGPWMASAHFTVRVDEPPAPPTGLTATPATRVSRCPGAPMPRRTCIRPTACTAASRAVGHTTASRPRPRRPSSTPRW